MVIAKLSAPSLPVGGWARRTRPLPNTSPGRRRILLKASRDPNEAAKQRPRGVPQRRSRSRPETLAHAGTKVFQRKDAEKDKRRVPDLRAPALTRRSDDPGISGLVKISSQRMSSSHPINKANGGAGRLHTQSTPATPRPAESSSSALERNAGRVPPTQNAQLYSSRCYLPCLQASAPAGGRPSRPALASARILRLYALIGDMPTIL